MGRNPVLLYGMSSSMMYRYYNTQGYDPYQIKKEELSGNISKFPPVK